MKISNAAMPDTRSGTSTYVIHQSKQPITLYQSSKEKTRYNKFQFHGGCLHSGAQRYVCYLSRAIAYDASHPGSLSLRDSATRFNFGETLAKSIGIIKIKFPVDHYTTLDLKIDVVHVDIPLRIGLDILRSRRLLVN